MLKFGLDKCTKFNSVDKRSFVVWLIKKIQ